MPNTKPCPPGTPRTREAIAYECGPILGCYPEDPRELWPQELFCDDGTICQIDVYNARLVDCRPIGETRYQASPALVLALAVAIIAKARHRWRQP